MRIGQVDLKWQLPHAKNINRWSGKIVVALKKGLLIALWLPPFYLHYRKLLVAWKTVEVRCE